MATALVSQVKISDPDKFQAYLTKSKALASSYGVELLYSGKLKGALNGEPHSHHMIVVAKFPDDDALHRWHSSPEYEALVDLREEGSEQLMLHYGD